MILFRQIAGNLTLFLNILLIFLSIFEDKVHVPVFLQVTGRLHPAIVHFPLVLIFVAIFLEWINARKKNNQAITTETIDFILYFFALTSAVAALFGLFLFKEGVYTGEEITLHKWLGTAAPLLAVAIILFRRLPNKNYYYGSLAVTAVGLTVAGHVGSEVTHGKGFVMEPVRRQQKRIEIEHPDSAIVFRDVIQPILNEKCVSCHNANKAKNELILTGYNDMMNGGEHRGAVVPGAAEKSLVYQYITLPMSDTLHMPPEGRLQLDREEIKLIGWWINSGAAEHEQYLHLPKVDSIHTIMADRFQPKSGLDLVKIAFADPNRIEALSNPYRTVSQISAVKPYVAVFLGSKMDFNVNDLKELHDISRQIVSIDLGNSTVSDADLKALAEFPHLQRLHLQNIPITDNGIQPLGGLRYLDVLNLSGTAITGKALEEISRWKNLRRLYIYNTAVDDQAIQSLRESSPQLTIFNTHLDLTDSLYNAQLTTPVVKIDSPLFTGSAKVEIKPSRGRVNFYYTLDGTNPTSGSSQYTASFEVNQSSTLKVIAMMEGWTNSSIATTQLMKVRLTPDKLQLRTRPDPKLSAGSDSVLVDKKSGGLDRGDKSYLVYTSNHFDAVFQVDKAVNLSQIALSFLRDIDKGVLAPEDIEVWVGMEENNMTSLGKFTPDPSESKSAEKGMVTVKSTGQPVKFIRIVGRRATRSPDGKTTPSLCVDEVAFN